MTAVPALGEPLAQSGRESVATSRMPRQGGSRRGLTLLIFIGPAALLLGVIVGYPVVATFVTSFQDAQGNGYVGLDNYRTMFGTARILTAIRNNAIWVIVFPFLVTFIGLVFAVLTERIRWATAFKTLVFAPMAISLFASGVIWRIVYDAHPERGVINAGVGTLVDTFRPAGVYAGAAIRPATGLTPTGDTFVTAGAVGPGGTLLMGITGINVSSIPANAQAAHQPEGASGAITGLVWRDFSPSHTPHTGQVYSDEKGLPGMKVILVAQDGSSSGSTTTQPDGSFRFDNVAAGQYRAQIDQASFRSGFQGVDWLGDQSLTPTGGLGETGQALFSVPLSVVAEIVAMLWVWSGFAMVIIGAGLAALNREVLEASRMDGATEWQTFRHVTLPLLRPVLIVVLVTMIINVLKIFDIVLALVPDRPQASNVIALVMWQVGFTQFNRGLASAIAVFLFLLVIPVMLVNVRRIRG